MIDALLDKLPTVLGLINYHVGRRLGFAIIHQVDGDAWRPWWHGRHVRGSWGVTDPRTWH